MLIHQIIVIITAVVVVALMLLEYLRYRRSGTSIFELDYPLSKLILRYAGLAIIFILVNLIVYFRFLLMQQTSLKLASNLLLLMFGLVIALVIIVLYDVYQTGKALMKKRSEIGHATAEMLRENLSGDKNSRAQKQDDSR